MRRFISWIRNQDGSDLIPAIFMLIIVCIVAATITYVVIDLRNPNYCNRACREFAWTDEVFQNCLKTERYTREECVRLVKDNP